MMPERMLRVEVVTLKSNIEPLVKSLHEAGLVHLEVEKAGSDWIKNASPLKKMDALSRDAALLREIRSIGKRIGVETGKDGKYSRADLQEIVMLQDEMNNAQKIIENADKKMEGVDVLRKLRLTMLPSSQKVHYGIFVCAPTKIEKVVIACDKRGLDFEYNKDANEAYIIIAGSAADREAIREIAKEFSLLPVKVNEGLRNVNQEIKSISNEKKAAERVSVEVREKIRKKLLPIMGSVNKDYQKLRTEIDRAEVVLKFGESERLYFIKGWIQEKDKEKLERMMNAHKDYASMNLEKPHHGELAPTSLKTPKSLKPFESLLTFISMPRSDEIDPTKLIALTLPIMFGIIVGDIGYSIVLMLLSAYFMNKIKGILGDIMKVIFISSFWGIFWGIFFAEFFGFELEFNILGIEFPIVNRLHGVVSLLLLTIGIGALHILLGNFLGMIEGIMHKEWKHAIAKACWVLLEIGLMGLVVDATIGGALAVVSIVGIVITEGPIGLIEVPGLIANIMSYARLAAVGLSGVILAFLINMMRPDPSQGLFMIVMFVIFAVAHFVAIGLAAFESLIQGGRLHAVEFFSKFFKGGGIPFSPFRMEEKV